MLEGKLINVYYIWEISGISIYMRFQIFIYRESFILIESFIYNEYIANSITPHYLFF